MAGSSPPAAASSTVVGRGPRRRGRPDARRGGRRRHLVRRPSSAATTSADPASPRPRPGRRDDPPLHARRDGRDLDRRGPLRARCSASSSPSSGPRPRAATSRPRRSPRSRRAPRIDVDADRRDRADDRPRRHRVRQPGRRVGRARGPLPPPRPDQQRRRRHRRSRSSSGPPASGCLGRLRPPAWRSSPAPGRRPRR